MVNYPPMKLFLTFIGLVNAAYMLIDGIYVIINGKYIGPEKPGPWARLFSTLHIDVFKLGPMFIGFGLLWFLWVYGLQTGQSWAYLYGIILSLATLWYLPFGTVIALTTAILLVIGKNNLGM